MPLGNDYAGQSCSMARTLEIVGERWTLLIVRDLLFGVRRFTELQRHLDIPRAVLAGRLATLEEQGIVDRAGRGYVLSERGLDLWPAVHALMQWGERHCTDGRPRRVFLHAACGKELDASGACPACGREPEAAELETRPGPGAGPPLREDPVSVKLREPHRLLQPLS